VQNAVRSARTAQVVVVEDAVVEDEVAEDEIVQVVVVENAVVEDGEVENSCLGALATHIGAGRGLDFRLIPFSLGLCALPRFADVRLIPTPRLNWSISV